MVTHWRYPKYSVYLIWYWFYFGGPCLSWLNVFSAVPKPAVHCLASYSCCLSKLEMCWPPSTRGNTLRMDTNLKQHQLKKTKVPLQVLNWIISCQNFNMQSQWSWHKILAFFSPQNFAFQLSSFSLFHYIISKTSTLTWQKVSHSILLL